ncbi:MAG: T9SS type A sorting domain-containing protein [Bacteroidetes bacterium]|nr:T9SS type A sorting domain-containing protein [Bacteroidota bacterium]
MNDETLYQNNLDKTIKIVENQIINSFTGFNYRANSFGIIKITLNYTEGTGGNSCSYLKFTNTGGAGDYVNIPYKNAIQNLHTGNFTIEMNVRGLTNTNYMVLFSNAIQQFHPFKNNITIAYNRFGTNNKIEFWQNNKKYAFNLCKNLNDNNWHHLAIVKSGTKMYCFIDNPIPCGTTTYSIAGYLPPVVADWSIGGGNKYKPTGTTTLGSYFGTTGDIDEVRIWKIARTGNELMSSAYLDITPTDPNLVAYWKFNDNTQTVTDAKSLANGTLGLNTTMANDDPSYQTSGCGGSRLMSQELPIIEKVFITKESLKVFPNPSSPSQIKFEFLSLTQQNAIIQIFDVQGKQLMLKNSLLSEGIQNIETDLALIDQKGMFFISVQTDKERFLQKFILQ